MSGDETYGVWLDRVFIDLRLIIIIFFRNYFRNFLAAGLKWATRGRLGVWVCDNKYRLDNIKYLQFTMKLYRIATFYFTDIQLAAKT